MLTWLGRRLREGERLQSPLRIGPATIEVFRSDARAEDGRAWVGGWEVPPSGAARDARWFAAELDRKCCPWVWAKAREPNRVIAALELLGTLLCLKCFTCDRPELSRGEIRISGKTDNRGNSFAVAKMMSTKWPLTVLILELVEEMRAQGLVLNLWVPRESNKEADSLSNLDASGFDASREIKLDQPALRWRVLGDLMTASEDLYKQIVREKDLARERARPQARPAKRRRTAGLGAW